MKAFKKYWAIFQITLINSLAYPGELIGRSLMIIPFMWIFYQLWKVTYALFTIIPAALMGAVPAEFVRAFTWQTLAELRVGAVAFLFLAVGVFRLGLKRYESGSAIQVEV